MKILHKPSATMHLTDGSGITICGQPAGGPLWQTNFKLCDECYVECPVCIEREELFKL